MVLFFLAASAKSQDQLVFKSFNPNASGCVDPVTFILTQTNPSFSQGWYKCINGNYNAVNLSFLAAANTPILASDYATGNGTTDDTAGLQAMINAAIVSGRPIQLAGGAVYKITSTLSIVNVDNFSMQGVQNAGAISRIDIRWFGANQGTPLLVDRCRYCNIGGFSIVDSSGVPGSGSRTIGVGIDIDDLGAGISTGDYFHDIGIYNATTGIRIGNVSTGNNELHIFDRVDVRLDPLTGGTTAVLIDDTQSKWHTFRNSSFGFADKGIAVTTGSFNCYTCGFSHNNRDVFTQEPSEAISIYSPQSETSGRFLETNNNPTLPTTVNIYGGRLSPDAVNADNNYIYFHKLGTLSIIGTTIDSGANLPNFDVDMAGGGATNQSNLNVISSTMPDLTFYTLVNSKADIFGSVYQAGGGVFTNIPDTNTDLLRVPILNALTSASDLYLQNPSTGGGINFFNGIMFFGSSGFAIIPILRPDTGGVNGTSFQIQAFNAANNWETVFSATNKTSGKIDASLVQNGGNVLINGTLADSSVAPTISSGFGTSPSIAANHGTIAFTVNVGTGGSATSGVIGLPTAANGWICSANDQTTTSTTVFMTKQTASSTTSATIGNFSTSGVAAAWVASDIINVSCRAR